MKRTAYRPVSFVDVKIEDRFWSNKIRLNRERTIPAIYKQCKDTGRIDAFRLNYKPGDPVPHVFWDSDVAKWIEAASYALANHYDENLDRLIDQTIDLVVSAQQPDGYLNTYFTVVEPEKRWTDLRDAHELYCAGHMMEAAVAHYQVTGKRKLLDAMCRYADHIATVFGPNPGQKPGYCGHPEIELALIRLYRATQEPKYLELSRFFVDERGKSPNYFDVEREVRGGADSYFDAYFREPGRTYTHEYNQSHAPVREQTRVTGHAVRAMYLYSAMVDLALETRDESLLTACKELWRHLTETRMYVTAGIGSSHLNEGFTEDYDLPNETAYCETCAAVGFVFWNHRLLHADLDGQFSDIIERALYNSVISGVSEDGKKFFYDNPLASKGNHHRREWFDVSCCPANLSRLLSTIGEYLYSAGDDELIVHQYIQSSTEIQTAGGSVRVRQITDYPWDGKVTVQVTPERPADLTVKLRLPGWCKQAELKVNGQSVSVQAAKGYVALRRQWAPGDEIQWIFDMPVERVYAHPSVKENRGRVAIQRGPVIYCLEEADNGKDLDGLYLLKDAELTVVSDGQPDGIPAIYGTAVRFSVEDRQLYSYGEKKTETLRIRMIPYFYWDNRVPGEMLVWIRERS
jgi:hypothetical protein